MDLFSAKERSAGLERMARDGVDVLVIGGGITGVSVAMDAAARGYRVGLVDKGDFASGTSSKSTKLVHGGIRYLPQFDFSLVREALMERGLLFQNAPWIVNPLGFVLPLYQWNKRPLGSPIVPPFGIGLDLIVQAGLLLYDLLAGKLSIEHHRRLSLAQARLDAPVLKTEGMKHAFVYYDGQTDDTRLTVTVLRTAVAEGALAANYTEVTGFEIADDRIQGARLRDVVTGKAYAVKARHIVNAAGVFAQRIEELTGLESQLSVEPAKGVHLIFSRDTIPMSEKAIVLPETDDGRLLFIVPWEERVIVGTTDTEGGDIDHPITTEEDVTYLLNTCNRYLNITLKREDILATYSGYRPLIKSKNADKASSAKLSRSHAVLDGPAGMVSIVGGKLTTWRRMAEDTMNYIAKRDGKEPSLATRKMALSGSEGWATVRSRMESGQLGVAPDVARHLGAYYGVNLQRVLAIAHEDERFGARIVSDLPYLMAEVVYACRYEMAVTLDDMLSRRTRLVLEGRGQGLDIANDVARIMAKELGWDDAEIARQVAAYESIVHDQYQERAERDGCRRPGDPVLADSAKKDRDDWANAKVRTVQKPAKGAGTAG
ncbi:glycerol-3-phosphate dehydrogenase [Capsulimonas corticalis]|uniref:Glycerol-3-phosphate dehydrogenase n=1 Tax=Capsulimonas corticalis TaxID=2219043 RepID=A0A402CU54_9BACT|nr:glycerol-3-phosphate dehydrogenase/oxidase [Capsulimonas corticalis]BDI28844.1 glycerol-3-phosphate dehydrogenase [Capsulimonas corticalis]